MADKETDAKQAPRKFNVTNDRTGDTKSIAYNEWADHQAQGYRVSSPDAFDQARAEAGEAFVPQQPRSTAAQEELAKVSAADATLIAQRTFPEAEGGEDAEAHAELVARREKHAETATKTTERREAEAARELDRQAELRGEARVAEGRPRVQPPARRSQG